MTHDDSLTRQETPEPVGREETDRTSVDPAAAPHSQHEEHQGDFAEGQTSTHVEPDALRGDFAEGQEQHERDGDDAHRGDFAEGQAGTHVPPDALRGDFAEGEEEHRHNDERR